MNERIEELAKQAVLQANEVFDQKGKDYMRIVMEKFAELILKDMHRKVVSSILITDVVMEEKGLTPTSEDYLRAIHKDFGVE